MINSYYGLILLRCMEENCRQRIQHHSFCHRMWVGDGSGEWAETSLFIQLCPAMCCFTVCILENLPWDPWKLILCVCVMEASIEDLRTIAIFKGRCGEISMKAISFIFYSLAPNCHLNSYIHSFNNHSFELGVKI